MELDSVKALICSALRSPQPKLTHSNQSDTQKTVGWMNKYSVLMPHPASNPPVSCFWGMFDQCKVINWLSKFQQLYPGGGLSKSGSGGKGMYRKTVEQQSYILRSSSTYWHINNMELIQKLSCLSGFLPCLDASTVKSGWVLYILINQLRRLKTF